MTARRVAEYEEREQAHLQEIAARTEALRYEFVSFMKGQYRDIGISRRAHAGTDQLIEKISCGTKWVRKPSNGKLSPFREQYGGARILYGLLNEVWT